uniref:vacuolar protein sorting-associated protein 8 homolog n=1 Tax=Ciona intestinalis TaxID=7719 RepID=UPI000180CD26|nr:vacuolar protein sorting-associated protein 8 homolog [Ciona intestinalis]|eukprot:XP_002121576.1 vacuolar protein sorting-associated protein 8 homolog [Ciona intestinalis]
MEDFEEFDDNDFDIPEVSVPTLESILNESDEAEEDPLTFLNETNESNPDDEANTKVNGKVNGTFLPELNVLKNWETSSITSSDSKKDKSTSLNHGEVLVVQKMESLSRQMVSAVDRVNAGRPTSLAVSNLIAIGTTRGLVILFDSSQALKYCLGSIQIGSKYGSVTALTFNTDTTRLLVGYAKGEILMYDVTNGKLLRTITDAHPPGSAVLHIKFTDDPTLAVCNDSGGSVFELNFRRLMGVRSCESRCLFSGSRGEVCAISTLHLNKNIADHPLRDRHMLAMGTLTKILVVVLRPQIKIVFAHRLTTNPTCVPMLAWQLTVCHSEGMRLIEPVLLFGRGDVLYFFQVKCDGWDAINFVHLRTMNITYKLINMAWLNSRTILLLDVRENLHVVDVDSQTGLQTKSIDHTKLIYSSSAFKSLANGGNVSQALAVIGEHACYHSMVQHNGKVYFLGEESVLASNITTWRKRIDFALERGHKHALDLALMFYDNSAKAVVGLPADPEQQKNLVSDVLLDVLVEFVDLSMTKLCPDSGKLQVLISFYRNVVPVCVNHCLHIGRVDVLFGRIYERFRVDCIAHGAFLECLEPYIMNDKLQTISPEVMQDFVAHYQAKGMLSSVESCLLHLDVSSLDLHQVLHLCWAHGLYDAIISIHNRGMKDYFGPLFELLSILQAALSTGAPLSEKMTTLGNKLLVYVSCCLAGVAYPHGLLDDETSTSVKNQMFETLIHPSISELKTHQLYPIIHIFLRFSTKEFLNVLSLSISEPHFQGREGFSKVQNFVDVLLQVMLESQGFRPDQIGCLFTFLARLSARQNSQIHLNETLKHQVLEFLTTPSDHATDHEERQQALVDLLQCGFIEESYTPRLVHLAGQASFFRVLRFLHTQQRKFDLVFVAYVQDPAQTDNTFTYVEDVLTSPQYTEQEKQMLKVKVLEHIKDLININGKKSVNLVTNLLQGTIQTIAAKLHDEPFVLYTFLRGLFINRDDEQTDFIQDSYFDDDVTYEAPAASTDPDTCELYLSLMCQFGRAEVLQFVQDCEYCRPHKALEIVRRYRVDEATAFLLEKSGDISAAFNILLNAAHEKIKLLSEDDESLHQDDAMSAVDDVIRLCQRNSRKLQEKQREKLWFSLLDVVLKPQHNMDMSEDKEVAKQLAQRVLTSMIGHMTLPAVLQKIIQDPAYKSGKFGEIRNLLLGMLETYQYERTLLNTTLNLLGRDRHRSLASLHKNVVHGVAPKSQFCLICAKSVLNNQQKTENLIIFRYGNVYHENCLNKERRERSSTKVGNDVRNFESNKKMENFRDGLLMEMKNRNLKQTPSTATKSGPDVSEQSFNPKNFKLRTKAPPIKF